MWSAGWPRSRIFGALIFSIVADLSRATATATISRPPTVLATLLASRRTSG
jgi:hypothetical protein